MEGNLTQINWWKKLQQLNPKLKVCQFENSRHLPGIYYVHDRDGIVDVCATDLEWVPEYTQYDSSGAITKAGYRRAVFILLHMNLTTKEKIKNVFGSGFFERKLPQSSKSQVASTHQQWAEMMKYEREKFNILGDAKQVDVQDKTMDKMKQMEIDNFNRRKSAALSGDQFVELAEDLKKEMPDDKKENLARAKYEYDKATGKTKSFI